MHSVMRGHSRSKNGVVTLAYDPRIHPLAKQLDGRVKSGHDERWDHSTLIFAFWMILRHFGSSDLTKLINSSGVPAIDWNR